MFVVFTTFTTATTMTHIIRAEIEKGARSIEVWFARAAMGGVPGVVCIPLLVSALLCGVRCFGAIMTMLATVLVLCMMAFYVLL